MVKRAIRRPIALQVKQTMPLTALQQIAQKCSAMKKKTLILSAAPLLAAFVVVGCKPQAESVNQTYGDPQEAALANAAAVELPPMLKEGHQYRCKDNSLIFVDFMNDDKTANFKTEKEGAVTVLKAPEAGQPFVSEDGSKKLEGGGASVTYNGLACKTG